MADKETATQLAVGPLALGGAANVPHAATYRRTGYALFAGASFRMMLDVGNWDASRTINAPGQSGDPYSGHYRDLAIPDSHKVYYGIFYLRPVWNMVLDPGHKPLIVMDKPAAIQPP